MEFKATGYVEKWDAWYAFTVLIDLVVVITAILPLIVAFAATCRFMPIPEPQI